MKIKTLVKEDTRVCEIGEADRIKKGINFDQVSSFSLINCYRKEAKKAFINKANTNKLEC